MRNSSVRRSRSHPARGERLARSSVYHDAAQAVDEGRLCRALGRLAARWPTYGYRRLTAMLRREGWAVIGKRVRRRMAEMGLQGKTPVRRRRTTDSRHDFPRDPYLVENLKMNRPDQVWVDAITYVRLREEFVYLAVVIDMFTRRVRGWERWDLPTGHRDRPGDHARLLTTPSRFGL